MEETIHSQSGRNHSQKRPFIHKVEETIHSQSTRRQMWAFYTFILHCVHAEINPNTHSLFHHWHTHSESLQKVQRHCQSDVWNGQSSPQVLRKFDFAGVVLSPLAFAVVDWWSQVCAASFTLSLTVWGSVTRCGQFSFAALVWPWPHVVSVPSQSTWKSP